MLIHSFFLKQAVCLLFHTFSWAATGCRTCHRTAHHFAMYASKKTKKIMAHNAEYSSIICNTRAAAQQGWDETGVPCHLLRRHKCCPRSPGNGTCFHSKMHKVANTWLSFQPSAGFIRAGKPKSLTRAERAHKASLTCQKHSNRTQTPVSSKQFCINLKRDPHSKGLVTVQLSFKSLK